jgi:hypothetical protein
MVEVRRDLARAKGRLFVNRPIPAGAKPAFATCVPTDVQWMPSALQYPAYARPCRTMRREEKEDHASDITA